MSSIRDQIIAEVVSRLNGAGKPAGVTVRRYSLAKIEPSQLPLIEVYPHQDVLKQPTAKGRQAVFRTLALMCDVYGQGDPLDQSIDAALCWITAALQADQSLGGLVQDVRDGQAEWDSEQAAMGTGLCKFIVEIDYIHTRNNQETMP